MQNIDNDEVKKMLEMLKEHQAVQSNNEQVKAQTTENIVHSDDDIKNMLKKHFSADVNRDKFAMSEDYSFDAVDFGRVDDEVITGEISSPNTDEINASFEEIEEAVDEIEENIEEIVEDDTTDDEIIEEEIVEEETIEEENIEEEIVEEETIEEEIVEEEIVEEEIVEEETIEEETIEEETIEEETIEEEIVEEEIVEEEIIEEETIEEEIIEEEIVEKDIVEKEVVEEVIAEESINYDDVLEGQQGTVFNSFVEDFSSDLDDVVFEAEITESRAPDKQYTIFEDWQQLMKAKDYETAEEGIIPPTEEELSHSAEIARSTGAASGNTDYFNPVTSADLDAVDIALMVALGGESELNQTVGFEKIRQTALDTEEDVSNTLENKMIFGCSGKEYTSIMQNDSIRAKYKKEKISLWVQTIGTAFLTLVLMVLEITGWIGYELPGVLSVYNHPDIFVLASLQILFLCAAISYDKFIKLFKNVFDFSSVAFFGALILLLVNVVNDVLVLAVGYADCYMIFHSLSACLFLLNLIYELFNLLQQSDTFKIISSSERKIVLEPYGKLRMGEGEDSGTGEIIDKDSYCISRVSNVNKFFATTSKNTTNSMSKLVSLILSFSVALCVMLVLLLMNRSIGTIVLSFILTLSFTLIVSAICESEFAFFAVHKALSKHKTGIIGKASVAEYGKCNIVYFDDFNVFSKKSVRTKGLKLYDNNEIYRVLYHTQAVFSKIGGPLKAVFEFATTEMVHSKNVEIKEISKEGIVAIVDGRTLVHIGTGAFMKSYGIHPKYTAADLKSEERGEESIMFIALGGRLGAKLYVTYQFSSEFELLARKLAARGVGIGIRSSDPNINNKWAKRYGALKKINISAVRPTLKEITPQSKSIEGGVVSTKNVRALTEALMMCIKLDSFEHLISTMRTVSVILIGILSFALSLLAGINTVSLLVLALGAALCASIMMLITHFYLKR